MTDSVHPSKDDGRGPSGSSAYDLWFDGLLDPNRAHAESQRVHGDAAGRARFEVDLAIEASLRRSFGAATSARGPRRGPIGVLPATRTLPWMRYAIAAGVLALLGAGLWVALAPTRSEPGAKRLAVTPGAIPRSRVTPQLVSNGAHPRTADIALGDVFLDALALEFQPRLDCQTKDRWDAELFAQLETAPCNQEQGVVVLGEWLDPRVSAANMVMLRRGENPIMLIVPSCGQETEMCVAKDSGLYVHRGVRDGRLIYEVSPIPDSEVLDCVDAQGVVTQQQL